MSGCTAATDDCLAFGPPAATFFNISQLPHLTRRASEGYVCNWHKAVGAGGRATGRYCLRCRPWVRVEQTFVFLSQQERADLTLRLSCAGRPVTLFYAGIREALWGPA